MVDRATVLDLVKREAARVLSVDIDDLHESTRFTDIGSDSLDYVEIVVPIEEVLDVDAGQEGLDRIVTVADFVDHLMAAC